MVVCLLVRHAVHDRIDRVLVGRTEGVPLSEAGRRQARGLAAELRGLGITAVQSSRRRRAIETAGPVAGALGLSVEICQALDEVDFGAWTGRSFEELSQEPSWKAWNERRGSARAPGGESMCEAQARIAAHIKSLHAARPDACVLLVTHAEMIRAAALRWMSLPLDAWWRVEVPPASVTRIEIRDGRQPSVELCWRSA